MTEFLPMPVQHIIYDADGKIISSGSVGSDQIDEILLANPTWGVILHQYATSDDHVDLSGPTAVLVRASAALSPP
jgi:hypothetical protein